MSVSELPNRLPRDDAGLKALAKHMGIAKQDLMVLAPANDPFNADTPAKRRDAEWFVELWQRFGYTSGIHVRRVHYRAERAGDVLMPNGMTYVNTVECSNVMEKASVAARDLGLIDPRLFIDRRNPPSRVFIDRREAEPDPSWDVFIGDRPLSAYWWTSAWRLPEIDPGDLRTLRFSVGHVAVDGYDYEADDQPYLLELWIEKSTMDDVLVPVCRDLGVNYTPGLGFTSKTRIAEMLRRGERHGKPVKVFVISDFDPAGSGMPASIARNIEFYRDLLAPGVDFAVHHIGMTREWVDRYELSRTPIKEEDRRKANFEAIHGEGCVELDALEAAYPGALAREIRAALTAYLDLDLADKLMSTGSSAEHVANEEWHAVTAPIRDELDQVRDAANEIAERYRERLTALAEELEADLEPHRASLQDLWHRLRTLARDEDQIQLPDRPMPEVPGCDDTDWLYRSDRHWLDQLARFRREKGAGS